tara:strand:- start:582 stop:1370 length:789 start_codon:yes stop_codon:yes gene_type:complete
LTRVCLAYEAAAFSPLAEDLALFSHLSCTSSRYLFQSFFYLSKEFSMKTQKAIKERRSIKHFDADHEMTAEEIEELLSLAALSPTAFNVQHWRFVVVDDPALRQAIRAQSWDQVQVTDASLLIVLCADLKAWEKQPERYWANADAAVSEFMLPAIKAYYANKSRVQRDEAMRSCGIAAQTIMLAAKAMGYDSCPMDGFDFNRVAQLIRLPQDHIISMFITVGKATEKPWPRPGQLPLDELLIKNRFDPRRPKAQPEVMAAVQ